MTDALVKYDAMCRAIEEAHRLDVAKEIHDQAAAMEAYAKQAKNKEAEERAREIRLRATRRFGEIVKAQKVAGLMDVGGRPKTRSKTDPVTVKPITLAEASIDKHLADDARKLAALPEAEFEENVKRPKEPRKPRQSKPVPASTRSHRSDIPKMVGARNSEACIEAAKKKLVADVGPVDHGDPFFGYAAPDKIVRCVG
jgi:hypothetical protein